MIFKNEKLITHLARFKTFAPFLGAILSGVLLFLSFSPFEIAVLGWVALVPLILACAGAAPRRAVKLGWLAGAVFFLASFVWLRHVSWLGMIGLAFYCALYFIPFALFISLRRCAWRSMACLKNLGWMVGAAAVWTASEYLRAHLITGFSWNLLGVSQYAQLPVIQLAGWGGVYVISALMVFVNGATAATLLQYLATLRLRGYKVHVELMAALFLVAAAWSMGTRVLLMNPLPEEPVRVALIQPNIPEVGNWQMADPELIYQRLEELTEFAGHLQNLDLIIWPETALPDCVRFSPRSAELVRQIVAKTGTPLLTGSMDSIWRSNGEHDYYNASMLFNSRGELLDSYYKQHLVLFGEYIPFAGKIPFINALTPIGSSFTPGKETTLFKLPDNPRGFSVLICFEDTLPTLARRAARRGATWLVNPTNDSWFDPDSGSKQHLANAVFRCVETRLPMLRCTNTGITCAINTKGKITQTLPPRTEGFQVVEVRPVDPNRPQTFYTHFGDLFAQACLLASIAVFIGVLIKRGKPDHA
jgi:apolipoprotein N-acyltransferase